MATTATDDEFSGLSDTGMFEREPESRRAACGLLYDAATHSAGELVARGVPAVHAVLGIPDLPNTPLTLLPIAEVPLGPRPSICELQKMSETRELATIKPVEPVDPLELLAAQKAPDDIKARDEVAVASTAVPTFSSREEFFFERFRDDEDESAFAPDGPVISEEEYAKAMLLVLCGIDSSLVRWVDGDGDAKDQVSVARVTIPGRSPVSVMRLLRELAMTGTRFRALDRFCVEFSKGP
jgi:hypothetical protein